jgi:radical SAM protein with 4Fe4S-binding SPASM domain
VDNLVISGGEPLTRFDLVKISIEKNAKLSTPMKLTVTTNGTLLSDNSLDYFADCKLNCLQISLDGSDSENNYILRGEDNFNLIISNIKKSIAKGIFTTVMTVPTNNNIFDLYAMHDLLVELGVKVWGIERPVAFGDENSLLNFSSEKLQSLHETIRQLACRGKLIIHCNDPILAVEALKRKKILPTIAEDLFKNECIGCSAGFSSCVISPSGDVRPCTFMNCVLGNVFVEPLRSIWDNSFSYLRNSKPSTGKCSICEYYELCKGCKAQILSTDKDLTQSDFACYL